MKPVYIKKIAAYAPGLETAEDWKAWAKGEKELLKEAPTPKLPFVPMLTRRRLSALSRMVVLVNHEVAGVPAKITFASEFGEIVQQLKISENYLDHGTVSPAQFSLSVFNASVANATILEKNEAGYSAVFAGKDSFTSGLKDCVAALQSGNETERIFIFADELLPEVYAPIAGVPYPNSPCALAIRMTLDPSDTLGELDMDFSKIHEAKFEAASDEALAYIKANLIKCF